MVGLISRPVRIPNDVTRLADPGEALVGRFRKLRATALEKRNACEKIKQERDRALAAHKEASEKLSNAYAAGAPAEKIERLETALADAQTTAAKPWRERVAGAELAMNEAAEAVGVFLAGHGEAMIAMLATRAAGLPERAHKLHADADEWISDRQQIDADVAEIVRFLPGVVTRDVMPSWTPPGDLGSVMRELESAPLPLPSRTRPQEEVKV